MTGLVFFVLCIALYLWCRSSRRINSDRPVHPEDPSRGGSVRVLRRAYVDVVGARGRACGGGPVVGVSGDGGGGTPQRDGRTFIPGWLTNPHHTMVIAAAMWAAIACAVEANEVEAGT